MKGLQYKSKWSGEPIPEENGLEECEREFCVYFSVQSAKKGMAEVGSHIPEITEALLNSKHFKINKNGLELSMHKSPRVIGVSGQMPVQSLLLKAPRKSGSLSNIVVNK